VTPRAHDAAASRAQSHPDVERLRVAVGNDDDLGAHVEQHDLFARLSAGSVSNAADQDAGTRATLPDMVLSWTR
jgi:hypothetical protein